MTMIDEIDELDDEDRAYKFDELSDPAKERARDWWRTCETEDFDTAFLFEDFETCAGILGIDFDQWPGGGGERAGPKIYYALYQQGSGACFEGRYSYHANSYREIVEHAPSETALHDIAAQLAALQAINHRRLDARVIHTNHNGCHERAVNIEVTDAETGEDIESHTVEEAVADQLRAFMRWMYQSIEAEYDYRMSDECVDENIIGNDYEFDEDGEKV